MNINTEFIIGLGAVLMVDGLCELYVSCNEPSKYKKLKIFLSILSVVAGVACLLVVLFGG